MKRSDEELEQQLQQWYRQSRQQNGLPVAVKKQLAAQIAATSQPTFGWQRMMLGILQLFSWRNIQALTAVLALGIGWQLLQQEQSYYQISQSNDVYPVQVHQFTPQQTPATPPDTPNNSSGQRQALYTQKYQDYLQASKNSQIRRQLIVSRQFSEDGWHLDVCQQMQLQLTSEWLAQFKLQQHWTEPQWQQLQQSDWLQITTGAEGQILALQRSDQPPACAP
ncbi:hypothetical protein A5320_09515 [Rheinheimera sp. SA_1]|uniref:hypothetical protein n=1 Tax=Rheinheimera sp. SA_1 TaxID=1827365 RepID=UPI0007FE505A|nr:hypothetical protein [Rheinheimera sp. SA_1]OBP15558.1 hypothetical protein A5320_09515 [Rheinheimera sp. SA_1]